MELLENRYKDLYECLFSKIREVDTESMLRYLGAISAELDRHEREGTVGKIIEYYVRHEVIAYLAKFSILKSNDYRRNEQFNLIHRTKYDYYKKLAEFYYELEVPLTLTENNNLQLVQRELLRMSYQQFSHYTLPRNSIGRMMFMFNDFISNDSEMGRKILLMVKKLTGLSLKEYLVTGLFIYTFSECVKGNLSELESKFLPSSITIEQVNSYIRYNSIGYVAFRTEHKKYSRANYLSKYEFNLLVRYPFIYTEKNNVLLCPVHNYALQRISYGIFYDLMDAFHDSENQKSNKFNEFVGKELFEKYTGFLLSETFTKAVIKGEQVYKIKRKEIRSVDWMLIENENEITLIECKLSDLSAESKTTDNDVKLYQDLNRKFLHGIKTCEHTLRDLENGKLNIGFSPNFTNINYLVISFLPTLFGNALYRQYVEIDTPKSYSKNYHFISISDFEKLCSYLLQVNCTLSSFLSFKSIHKDCITWDFSAFINEHNKINDNKVKDLAHPILERRAKEIFDEIKLV